MTTLPSLALSAAPSPANGLPIRSLDIAGDVDVSKEFSDLLGLLHNPAAIERTIAGDAQTALEAEDTESGGETALAAEFAVIAVRQDGIAETGNILPPIGKGAVATVSGQPKIVELPTAETIAQDAASAMAALSVVPADVLAGLKPAAPITPGALPAEAILPVKAVSEPIIAEAAALQTSLPQSAQAAPALSLPVSIAPVAPSEAGPALLPESKMLAEPSTAIHRAANSVAGAEADTAQQRNNSDATADQRAPIAVNLRTAMSVSEATSKASQPSFSAAMPATAAMALSAPEGIAAPLGVVAPFGVAAPGQATSIAAPANPATAFDIGAIVNRIVAAQQSASGDPTSVTMQHEDFGRISLNFMRGADGLDVEVKASDGETQRAIAAAIAIDRPHIRFADNLPHGSASPTAATQGQFAADGGDMASARGERGETGETPHQNPRNARETPSGAANAAASRTGDQTPRQRGIFA